MPSQTHPVKLTREFKTKSGADVSIATGTGTKWKKDSKDDDINQELVDQILLALKSGFRHIDTAEVYNTQAEVGAAVKQLGIPREDLWITTKYNPGWRTIKSSSASPNASIDKALQQLGTDYIDLYLIHQPFFTEDNTHGFSLEDTWKILIDYKKQGKIREIGVSNFTEEHIERLKKILDPEFYPVVNQIESHPFLQDQSKGITAYSQANGILVEAFSPLTPVSRIDKNTLTGYLEELSKKYNKTGGQILLRWTLQRGVLPITTSAKEERIKEALDVFDFELTKEEFDKITEIGQANPHRVFFHEEFKGL
ncbi:NADPH-dependent conjugated polyketone reductase C2 [Candida viswanathii]|uniref:2-dehydropantolactone reductase n=1 Tax=Candida viswanathii TaxID=5486 RepID=A0A367YI05_9ASCO|nr:NADPH-dependent conjugated polyketone reductase C2 [Candida viswanathii]